MQIKEFHNALLALPTKLVFEPINESYAETVVEKHEAKMTFEEIVKEVASKFTLTESEATNVATWLEQNDDLTVDVEEKLYSFYMDSNEMPYGTAKARDGDPQEWIFNRLTSELGLET